MSFWERLGSAAEFATNASGIGLAWEIAKATGGVEDSRSFARRAYDWQFEGDRPSWAQPRPLAPVSALHERYIGVPATSVAEALHKPYEYGVARPLSSGIQVLSTASDGDDPDESAFWSQIADSSNWSKAWRRSQEITLGQSAVIAGTGRSEFYGDEYRAVRNEFFTNTWAGRLSSGTIDAVANIVGDPLLVGGKVSKVVRASRSTLRPEEVSAALARVEARKPTTSALEQVDGIVINKDEGTKAVVEGSSRRVDRFATRISEIEDQIVTAPGLAEVMQLDWVRRVPDAAPLGTLLWRAAQNADEGAARSDIRLLIGASLGDEKSIGKLATERASLSKQLSDLQAAPSVSQGQAVFRFDDHGQGEIDFFNNPDGDAAINERITEIEDEMTRLDQVLVSAAGGTGRRVFSTAPEKIAEQARINGLHTTTLFDGPMSRPVRLVHSIGHGYTSGFINTVDPVKGLDELQEVLARTPWLDAAEKRTFINDFTTAVGRNDRNKIVRSLDDTLFHAAGRREGLTPEEIRHFMFAANGVRRKWSSARDARLYSGRPFVTDNEGMIHYYGPRMRSQLAELEPITDPQMLVDVMKRNRQTRAIETFSKRHGERLLRQAGQVHNIAEAAYDTFDHVASSLLQGWKFLALLRLAYPQRIMADTSMRLASSVGAMNYLMDGTVGSVNIIKNMRRVADPDLYARLDDVATRIKTVGAARKQADASLARKGMTAQEHSTRVQELDRQLSALQDEAQRATGKKVRRGRTEQRASILREPTSVDVHGVKVPTTAARGDAELAVLNRKLDYDGSMSDIVFGDISRRRAEWLGQYGWSKVPANDPGWADAYLRAVNQQWRNSPVGRKILESDMDSDVIAFIKSDRDAFREWVEMRDQYGTIENWVHVLREDADHLFPVDELRAVAIKRPIRDTDLSVAYTGREALRPDVHGTAYTGLSGTTFGKVYREFRAKWFHYASTMPETLAGRHPFYKERFKVTMEDQLATYRQRIDEGAVFDPDEIEKMRVNADRIARRDMANTLFDLSNQSGGAHAFRHISPFFSAWEDTMRKWGRLIYDDPSILSRLNQAWRSPFNASFGFGGNTALVVDSNGNPVNADGEVTDRVTGGRLDTDPDYSGSGRFVILPSKIAKILHAAPENSDTFALNLDSFNVLFQGEIPWLPGFGPAVQVPANEVGKRWFPELDKGDENTTLFRAVLPFGYSQSSVVEQSLPSWVRNVKNAFDVSSEDRTLIASRLMQVEITKKELGLRDTYPTEDEIANMARNWMIYKALLSNVPFVTANPQPKFQFYIEEGRKYSEKDDQYRAEYSTWEQAGGAGEAPPRDSDEAFMRDYPEFFAMKLGLRVNETGIQAFEETIDPTRKYLKQIKANPEYGFALVGKDNLGGEFHHGAWIYQQHLGFRSSKDPGEIVRLYQEERGWAEFNEMQTYLNLELEKRGLHSLQQNGAEDLQAYRNTYLYGDAGLTKAYPLWAERFGSAGEDKSAEFINTALGWMRNDSGLAKRPDMALLLEYVQVRDDIRSQLQAREFKTLEAQANADLAAYWGKYTQLLVGSDPAFEQMWNRVLQNDTLRDPVGGA